MKRTGAIFGNGGMAGETARALSEAGHIAWLHARMLSDCAAHDSHTSIRTVPSGSSVNEGADIASSSASLNVVSKRDLTQFAARRRLTRRESRMLPAPPR